MAFQGLRISTRLLAQVGTLIITVGFGGPLLYYNYDKEPPTIVLAIIEAPIV